MKELRAAPEHDGLRLDRVLAQLTGISLRTSRRMIEDGRVSLNGRTGKSARKISQSDRILLAQAGPEESRLPEFLGQQDSYCFFYKPPCLHTTALAGRDNRSLEAYLPELQGAHRLPCRLQLLQRLDWETAGIICAATGPEAVSAFREAEKAGKCCKYYFALVEGDVSAPFEIRNRLETNGRKRVRALPEAGPEINHTYFEPVWRGKYGPDEIGASLLECRIRSGLRHQIRCHCAVAGHPLLGDALYGSAHPGHFLLEHYGLEFPGHGICYRDRNSELAQILRQAPESGRQAECM